MNVNEKQIIVDFICRKLKLVIEIDGYSHKFKHKEDIIRDQHLTGLGYHVLRFTEQEVRHRIDDVVSGIAITIEELEKEQH
jgi:very-short-patch-repair endonuclease